MIDDGPRQTLLNSKCFQEYDLVPLSVTEVNTYLHDVRVFENIVSQFVFQDSRPEHLHPRIPEETQHLKSLLRRSSGQAGAQESVISTPLLMHFASLLEPEGLAAVKTLSDLYDRVTDLQIVRDLKRLDDNWMKASHAKSGISPVDLRDGPDQIRQAMTRLAALIVNQPEGVVTVTRDAFEEALTHPEDGSHDQLGGKPWWPQDEFWHAAPWVIDQYSPEAVRLLREFSLIRCDGPQVRFLHDSLIYYFAARALRRPRPTRVLPTSWPMHAATQLRSWPGPRREVAEFLGGTLDDPQFQAMFLELLAGPADATTAQSLDALIRGAAGKYDIATRLQSESVRRSGWSGLEEPDLLLSELHEALITERDRVCTEFAVRLETRMRAIQRSWLRTVFPRRVQNNCKVMTAHFERVETLSCWIYQQDPSNLRIISGDSTGATTLWDPNTGRFNTTWDKRSHFELIKAHWQSELSELNEVNSIGHFYSYGDQPEFVVLPNGSSVLRHRNGTVTVTNPATGQVEHVDYFQHEVICLSTFPDGHVALGFRDSCKIIRAYIGRWCPSTRHIERVADFVEEFRWLSVLDDGRVAVMYSTGEMAIVELTGGQEVDVRASVATSMAFVYYDGGRWIKTSNYLITDREISCLVMLPDGRVVLGDETGTVELAVPEKQAIERIASADEYEILRSGRVEYKRHGKWWRQSTDEIDNLEVLPDGHIATWSSRNNGKATLWNPDKGQPDAIIDFEFPISRLVGFPDGCIAAVSGNEGIMKIWDRKSLQFVKQWDPDTRQVEPMFKIEPYKTDFKNSDAFQFQPVIVAMPDGRIAGASYYNAIRVWGDDDESVAGSRGPFRVLCLGCSADGRQIYAGLENGELLFLQVEPASTPSV